MYLVDASIWAKIPVAVLFVLIIFLALAGNCLVCFAIFSDRRLQKPENLFLISLAVSDILVAILVMTFAALNDLVKDFYFGSYCSIWLSSDVMCCTASIYNLCAISFDRYWHIKHPLRYCLKMTRTKIVLIILFVWILSAGISFVPIHLKLSAYGRNLSVASLQNGGCEIDFTLPYTAISSSISFFIPCAVMICIYAKLYRTAKTHLTLLQRQFQCLESAILLGASVTAMHAFTTTTPLDTGRSTPSSTCTVSRTTGNDKAKLTVGVIMGVFLACWLPFFVVNIARSACQCIPMPLFQTVTWIGYANSTANPIIYSIFSKDFRRAFRKILSCKNTSLNLSIAVRRTKQYGAPANANGRTAAPLQAKSPPKSPVGDVWQWKDLPATCV